MVLLAQQDTPTQCDAGARVLRTSSGLPVRKGAFLMALNEPQKQMLYTKVADAMIEIVDRANSIEPPREWTLHELAKAATDRVLLEIE